MSGKCITESLSTLLSTSLKKELLCSGKYKQTVIEQTNLGETGSGSVSNYQSSARSHSSYMGTAIFFSCKNRSKGDHWCYMSTHVHCSIYTHVAYNLTLNTSDNFKAGCLRIDQGSTLR